MLMLLAGLRAPRPFKRIFEKEKFFSRTRIKSEGQFC